MTVSAQLLLLLFVASSFHKVRALDCTSCQSEASWEDCQQTATVMSCTTDEVNDFHGVASIGNPTLSQGSLEDGFQCFALHVRSKDSGPATSPDRFSKGCTFAKTEFCQGWSSTLEVVKCETDVVITTTTFPSYMLNRTTVGSLFCIVLRYTHLMRVDDAHEHVAWKCRM
uniref:(northern house mosquito) hypothetical protein n=1 Tax=Culex pipiens TaxID=7175 RepID=A0A8D8MAX8_CULPI